MPNRDLVPDDKGMGFSGDMQHREVLNIGSLTDPNKVDIAAYNRVKPDGAVISYFYITNDIRRRRNKNGGTATAGGRNFGCFILKNVNHNEAKKITRQSLGLQV